MSSWRDRILKEFTPKVAWLTLVADPDGLILEEGILEGIRNRGFELIPLEDHIAFRYAFELKLRTCRDRGEPADLIIVLPSQASGHNQLPYDLLQAGRRLSFNLGDIFPNLSYPIVTALDRGNLDALYEAQEKFIPGQLGDNATREFILRHVFEVAPEQVKQPLDLLRVLLRRHYRVQRIPADLDDWFIQLLRQSTVFNDWPLERIVSDREAFFAFLQERWPSFLDREAAKFTLNVREEVRTADTLSIAGPLELPFDHYELRGYINNLFVEGFLHSVPHEQANTLAETWIRIGLSTAPTDDRFRRLTKLIDSLEKSIPSEDAKHTDWFHFARGWAEAILLANNQTGDILDSATGERIKALQAQMDISFTAWLLKRYAGLVNLPPLPPVMLHHLPRFLARQLREGHQAKVALIVVDGLALDQWLVVRKALSSRQPSLIFREQTVFAWIPSLTSISRQTAFAGKAPFFFPSSIQSTDKEHILWSQFWADHGLTPSEIAYIKGLGDGGLEIVSEALAQPKAKVIGLVVDKVDKIMHGMEMGTAGMHNQVGQWAKQPYLNTLLNLLLDQGFHIYLTSDHGNVEATGCGRPAEGAVADLRGERVRIYPDAALRHKVKEDFPAALEWDSTGLPDKFFPLLAPPRQAFIHEKRNTVSHGGVSVEEVIVPFIQIERECK